VSLVQNERTKLSAAALNGVAIASIVAGFITPLAAVTFGIPGAAARGVGLSTIFSLLWLLIGLGLHFLARRLLGGLKE
jgi:Mg/Co/Ni transporter MgtE